MAELLLIARLGGRRIAFPASKVEAVVELEGITPGALRRAACRRPRRACAAAC